MSEDFRKPLRFKTHNAFAERLVLSVLTGRKIHISQIRSSSSTNPGLAPHEISLLRLIESITNGSQIEISYTGTSVLFSPGIITGCTPGSGSVSGVLKHELPANCTRGVSYFLRPLCLLAPFSKAPVNVLFTGPGVITSATEAGDMSADSVRTSVLPLFAHFGIRDNLELRIIRRSCAGNRGKGGLGEVQLVFGKQVRLPTTAHLMNAGRIKRIRGVAYCIGVSSSNNARMIESARGLLNPMVSDVYIFSDVSSAPKVPATEAGIPSKGKVGIGYGLSLVAESSTGMLFSSDTVSPPDGGVLPEDIGRKCALQLLEAISEGGTVPLSTASISLIMMAMGPEDVGRIELGKQVVGSPLIVGLARDLRLFGGSDWGIKEVPSSDTDVIVSIVGRGVGNVGKKVT